jgi:two-component system, LytTR family, sensor kinase
MIRNIEYNKFERNRWLWHLVFWVSYVLFFTILYGSFDNDYYREFMVLIELLPFKIAVTYLMLYVFVPKFLLRKKYFLFAIFFIITSITFGVPYRLISYYYLYPIYWPEHAFSLHPLNVAKIIKSLVSIYTVTAIAILIKLIKLAFHNQQETNKLNSEKLEAELKFLKSQIHPHFLFNTLNNLYALTLKKDDKAPEIVLKLSELLDYMLYECNVPTIDIKREISHIENYIDLEKIRYGDRLKVDFINNGKLSDVKIAPMLILPFVENAFKHGASGEIESPWIKIDLSIDDKQLVLNVENSKETRAIVDDQGYTEGIGLKNVKRRLELLYKNNYKLDVVDKGKAYLVVLKLNF